MQRETRETREQALSRIAPLLTEREIIAYDYWRQTEQLPLAPSTNAKLFNLFLNGKSCEEIRKLNQQLSLGQIVAARIEGDWDARRDDHLNHLLNETVKRVQQASLETTDFLCDMLTVANKEHGGKLRAYIQNSDPKELGDFRITSLQGLKTVIETIQKTTGVDRHQKITVTGEVVHRQESKTTSEQANEILKQLMSPKK